MSSMNLTDKTIDAIREMRHSSNEDIATAIGVHRTTLTRWKQKGRKLKEMPAGLTDAEKRYVAVYDILHTAKIVTMNACVQNIITAGAENWQAAAWWLERRYPLMFGKKVVFNPNQMEDYLRVHYGEEVTEQILTILENAAAQNSREEGTDTDTDDGTHTLTERVDDVPSDDSTLSPELKYAKLDPV